MSIEKMELVNIAGLMNDLDEVLLKCCESSCFHIEAPQHSSDQNGFKALREENPYSEILKKVYSLTNSIGYNPKGCNFDKFDSKKPEDLYKNLSELEHIFKEVKDKVKVLKETIAEREQAKAVLLHLEGVSADYENIFSCENIRVRFGKLPVGNYEKLYYYEDKPFEFFTYDKDNEYYWGIYFVPNTYRQIVDDIFDSLYFERIRIPDFVHGTGKAAFEENEEILNKSKEEFNEKNSKLQKLIEENSEKIDIIFSKVKYLNDTFELRKNASVINDKFYLVGFVPEKDAKRFIEYFDNLKDVSVVLAPPDTDPRLTPPSKIHTNKFAEPFSMFVGMYGLPDYGGFNPTTLVAITYTLMFGIMFGDLGQGIVVALLGLYLAKKKKSQLGQILERVGISSAFFGLIYGSVFGYETLLDPLYKMIGLKHKPIEVFESSNFLLIGAIAIGVLLILVTIFINICINIKKRDYISAFFGNNGIAGFVFYGAVLFALVETMMFNKNIFKPWYIILFLVLPLLVMFFREPLGKIINKSVHTESMDDGIGNFIAVNFFELFEFLLGYVTNTMSFLRIGGFVLSHAGMMLVVMTLAEGVSAGAAPIIVILGNIFVIGMEGLIVGIQVLRLEFYEIFSRFYEGNGREFKPVKVDYSIKTK